MKLSAIILARVLAFVETFDLSPEGRIFWPDIAREIAARYSFQKFPATLAEFDESKGVEFLEGKAGDKVIQKFVVWENLLVIETRSGTADSKKILEDMLLWGAEKFGLNYRPGMIKQFAYVSDVSFYSEIPMLAANSALSSLAARTSEALTQIWQEPVHYEPLNFMVGHDPATRKYAIAPFSITRRAEARFMENKYFSEAPLPTELHLRLLEDYEKDLAAAMTPPKKV